jgi:hypothetical protein
MGKLPNGKAQKRVSTPSVSALLLAGVQVFISFLSEEEEANIQKRLKLEQSVEQSLQPAVTGSRYVVDQAIHETTTALEEKHRLLKKIPILAKDDPEYVSTYNERLRRMARLKLSTEAHRRATKQAEKMPERFEFYRVPLKDDVCLSVQDVLPVLWKIEKHLASGYNVYIYSEKGQGR